jgi:hypothetical protein
MSRFRTSAAVLLHNLTPGAIVVSDKSWHFLNDGLLTA